MGNDATFDVSFADGVEDEAVGCDGLGRLVQLARHVEQERSILRAHVAVALECRDRVAVRVEDLGLARVRP